MNKHIRNIGDLSLNPEDKSSILSLQVEAEAAKVESLEHIFSCIENLHNVKSVSIADDYLDPDDASTKYFISKIENNFSHIILTWFGEGKIDGRHGR
ncbi:hypothetical protein [Pseudomonas sp.]|uniref:hypothetical protein n=1 Tax=Pseudomonas sp. TaxID=306 RepID=UPI0019F217D5|nr:hypothetical protein [Pseudomonas sp.]MBF0676185.1 hypothetical protein [Pseudomonas sp.]